MQLLIDTETMTVPEMDAVIHMLSDIVDIKDGKCDPSKNDPRHHDKYAPSMDVAAPPPPPPAFPLATLVSEADLEVETDEAGTVTSLAVSVAPPAIPAPPGPAVAPDLDSTGLPYDGRIHGLNRATTIKGAWKNKRGVDPAVLASVEAELRANFPMRAAGMTAPLVPLAPPAPLAPPPPPPAPSDAGSSVPPVTVVAPPPPASPALAPVTDFRSFMQKISALTSAGKLTDVHLRDALASVGLKPDEMAQLVNNMPLISSANAAIDKAVGAAS